LLFTQWFVQMHADCHTWARRAYPAMGFLLP